MKWSFASADAPAARAARKAFTSFLREQATPGSDILSAELTFGELVGNAVRHAPGPVVVTVEWKDGYAMLRVHNEGPAFVPNLTPPKDIMAESGRGLFLIAQLSHGLRVDDIPNDGTCVTVRLPVRQGAFAARA